MKLRALGAVAVTLVSLLRGVAGQQGENPALDDGGMFGLSESAFILLCLFGSIIACGCFLAVCTRICGKSCACCGGKGGGAIAPRTLDPFRRANPMKKPTPESSTTDLEGGTVFEFFHYPAVEPLGTVEDREGILVFEADEDVELDEEGKVVSRPGTITTEVITVQANRCLSGPNPRQLSKLRATFYEVTVVYQGMQVQRLDMSAAGRGKPNHTDIAVGFAVAPYPPYEMVGEMPYSIALTNKGVAVVNRGGAPQRHRVVRGFGQGAVVGAGYELRAEAGVIEFFFTVNGVRMPSLPDQAGVFDVMEVEKYYLEMIGSSGISSAGPGYRHEERAMSYMKDVVIDHNLLCATPYPTISARGMAAIEPNLTGPHQYAPYMEIFGKIANPTGRSGARGRRASIGSKIVASSTVPGPGMGVTRGRRASIGMPDLTHTHTGPGGMGRWKEFQDAKSALDSLPAKGSGRALGGPRQDQSALGKAKKWGRRMSAPSALVGDVLKGLAERAENLGGNTRAGRRNRTRQQARKKYVQEERKRRASVAAEAAQVKRNEKAARRASVSYEAKAQRAELAKRARRASMSSSKPKRRRSTHRRRSTGRRRSVNADDSILKRDSMASSQRRGGQLPPVKRRRSRT